jgi:hypothetical protein
VLLDDDVDDDADDEVVAAGLFRAAGSFYHLGESCVCVRVRVCACVCVCVCVHARR